MTDGKERRIDVPQGMGDSGIAAGRPRMSSAHLVSKRPRKALTASNSNPGEPRSGRRSQSTSYPLSYLLR